MIVRISSHRANSKLTRVAPTAVSLYHSSTMTPGFMEVPDDVAEAARKITGITRARDQDRSHYGKSWGQS